MPDQPLSEAADFWSRLRSTIQDFLRTTKLEWRYRTCLDLPKETAQTVWLGDSMRNRKTIDGLVAELIETGSIREEDPELRYFLAVRFAAALEIVRHLTFVADGQPSTIFLPAHNSQKEALTALLIDWWWGHGVFLAFEMAWERKMTDGLLDP